MSQYIVSGNTYVQDFVVTCGAKHGEGLCEGPARFYVELHRPGRCRHPAFNTSGNHEMFVCLYHLGQLEKLAEKELKKLRPPWWVRLFRDDDWELCTSCHRRLQTPADILQVVLGIGERNAA